MQLSGQNLQMALIKVIKKDEVHIKVDTDPSTAQEICDFFSHSMGLETTKNGQNFITS